MHLAKFIFSTPLLMINYKQKFFLLCVFEQFFFFFYFSDLLFLVANAKFLINQRSRTLTYKPKSKRRSDLLSFKRKSMNRYYLSAWSI